MAEGTIGFTDPDADIVRAYIEVVSDPNGAFGDPFDFDPEVHGQTEGSFTFQLGCPDDSPDPCTTGSVTLGMILEDGRGNRSERVDFSFEIVEASTSMTARAGRARVSPKKLLILPE